MATIPTVPKLLCKPTPEAHLTLCQLLALWARFRGHRSRFSAMPSRQQALAAPWDTSAYFSSRTVGGNLPLSLVISFGASSFCSSSGRYGMPGMPRCFEIRTTTPPYHFSSSWRTCLLVASFPLLTPRRAHVIFSSFCVCACVRLFVILACTGLQL